MAFALLLTFQAQEVLDGIRDPKRHRRIENALAKLAENPRHPGLHSHRFEALDGLFEAQVWESYVENRAPQAWRLWWVYGPLEGTITVVTIGPHA
jgi:hypothetical protein